MLYPDRTSPKIIFGPDVNELHYSLNSYFLKKKYSTKVAEVNSYKIGVINIALEDRTFYKMHQRQKTMPDIKYDKISWKNLLLLTK